MKLYNCTAERKDFLREELDLIHVLIGGLERACNGGSFAPAKSLHWALVPVQPHEPFQSIYRIIFLSIFERPSSLHNSSVHASNLVPLITGADEMEINKQITMLG